MSGTETDRDMVSRLTNLDVTIHTPARLAVMAYLYVVDSADYLFLMQISGLTWGNLATHLGKLEEAGYIAIEKEFRNKKPYSMVQLTSNGREAFRKYKDRLKEIMDGLPD